jgi:hypothetical protein
MGLVLRADSRAVQRLVARGRPVGEMSIFRSEWSTISVAVVVRQRGFCLHLNVSEAFGLYLTTFVGAAL